MSRKVQSMFSSIAHRYDLANDLLSFGIHRLWKRNAIGLLSLFEDEVVLDLCCGTGDLAFHAAKEVSSKTHVIGLDLSLEMLKLAHKKKTKLGLPGVCFTQADAMRLPLSDSSVDVVTIGFGIRNVDDTLQCLREIKRVLCAKGKLLVLEFGRPQQNPVFSLIYHLYSSWVIPLVGGLVSGDLSAYRYLPKTSRTFPCGEEFLSIMREAGFENPRFEALSGEIAYIYLG